MADENIPTVSLRALREGGHDVLAASEFMPGAADRVVLERAGAEARVLVTFDRDFGALIFKQGVSAPAGVLLLRFVPVSPEEPGALLLEVLSDPRLRLASMFTVVDRDRVRQRSLHG